MTWSVGIVGLPNSGKSTLFNALVGQNTAKIAITPFTTISHNEAVVEDICYLDIAGLVRGSHQGQGFGNAFLEKIRGVDLLLHVVRAFYSTMVGHPHKIHEPGSLQQVMDDIDVVRYELKMAGMIKPVIYVLNFDEYKMSMGMTAEYISFLQSKFQDPVVAVCAKIGNLDNLVENIQLLLSQKKSKLS